MPVPAHKVPSPSSEAPAQETQTTPTLEKLQAPTPEYTDDDKVCVTFGYGLNDANSQGFFVNTKVKTLKFSRDRVCQDVPYAAAKELQKLYGGGVVRIHPNNATQAQIIRACGVRPMEEKKVAAMLLASDLDKVVAGFSDDDIKSLAAALQRRAQAIQH